MKLKSNLHMHVAGDPEDHISYTLREATDTAKKLGFSVLAVTPHNALIGNESDIRYAANLGILLILGIERTIEGAHVVILNASADTLSIETFEDLIDYRKNHPESFIIAPHPFFPAGYVLGKKFVVHHALFDAVEFSWFFSKMIDFNVRAAESAKTYGMPYLATSDTHDIRFLNAGYAVIDTDEKSPEKIFEAIRKHAFRNVSAPKNIFVLAAYMMKRWGLQLLKRK
jgi:predicted metal-dependent phosphoesterase TrpH